MALNIGAPNFGVLNIGNAPCSWGVEFADDPRNPAWERVLDEARDCGYRGIELGPIGFLPEDAGLLSDTLESRGLTLTAGVLFRPIHDPKAWDDALEAARRTCRSLQAMGAAQFVIIDSIAERRAATAGRPEEAHRLDPADWNAMMERLRTIARMAVEEYGLVASIHAHAAGFIEFEDELERTLEHVDAGLLKICVDTGHCVYAGYDPVALIRRHAGRVAYLHFKDVSAAVKAHVVANRVGFYDACAQGLFCNLGDGAVDFQAVKDVVGEIGFGGWATVEQDCDPAGDTSPVDDARGNYAYLRKVGIAT